MAGPSRIAGIASFYVDGQAVTTKGSLKYQPTSTKREPIMAMDGSLAGYAETGEAPFMSVTMLDMGSFRVADLFDNTNIQIVATLANKKVVTGHSMTIMEAIEVSNDDATFEVKFTGLSVTERAASV